MRMHTGCWLRQAAIMIGQLKYAVKYALGLDLAGNNYNRLPRRHVPGVVSEIRQHLGAFSAGQT